MVRNKVPPIVRNNKTELVVTTATAKRSSNQSKLKNLTPDGGEEEPDAEMDTLDVEKSDSNEEKEGKLVVNSNSNNIRAKRKRTNSVTDSNKNNGNMS